MFKKIINSMFYLISTSLCFVIRRKRKGKAVKGRAKSGGRAHQKGSKQQSKAAQQSPVTCPDLKKLPITEDVQSEQSGQADEPHGVPSSNNHGDPQKDSAGQTV